LYLVQKWTIQGQTTDAFPAAATRDGTVGEQDELFVYDHTETVDFATRRAEIQPENSRTARADESKRVEVVNTRRAIIRRSEKLGVQIQIGNLSTMKISHPKQENIHREPSFSDSMAQARQEQAYIEKIRASEQKEIRVARSRRVRERQAKDWTAHANKHELTSLA
jgi:hypothetical protein